MFRASLRARARACAQILCHSICYLDSVSFRRNALEPTSAGSLRRTLQGDGSYGLSPSQDTCEQIIDEQLHTFRGNSQPLTNVKQALDTRAHAATQSAKSYSSFCFSHFIDFFGLF